MKKLIITMKQGEDKADKEKFTILLQKFEIQDVAIRTTSFGKDADFQLKGVNNPSTYRPSRIHHYRKRNNLPQSDSTVLKRNLKTKKDEEYTPNKIANGRKKKGKYSHSKKYSFILATHVPAYTKLFGPGVDKFGCGLLYSECRKFDERYIFPANANTNQQFWYGESEADLNSKTRYNYRKSVGIKKIRENNKKAVEQQKKTANELLLGCPEKNINFIFPTENNQLNRLLALYYANYAKNLFKIDEEIPVFLLHLDDEPKVQAKDIKNPEQYSHTNRIKDLIFFLENKENVECLKASCKPKDPHKSQDPMPVKNFLNKKLDHLVVAVVKRSAPYIKDNKLLENLKSALKSNGYELQVNSLDESEKTTNLVALPTNSDEKPPTQTDNPPTTKKTPSTELVTKKNSCWNGWAREKYFLAAVAGLAGLGILATVLVTHGAALPVMALFAPQILASLGGYAIARGIGHCFLSKNSTTQQQNNTQDQTKHLTGGQPTK